MKCDLVGYWVDPKKSHVHKVKWQAVQIRDVKIGDIIALPQYDDSQLFICVQVDENSAGLQGTETPTTVAWSSHDFHAFCYRMLLDHEPCLRDDDD